MYLVLSWRYLENLCKRIALDIIDDGFQPEKIVGLAKGGVFAATLLSDYLGVTKIGCIDVKEGGEVCGDRVLVVDDFINTGSTMKKALGLLNCDEVKTASLLMLENSEFIPDYLGDYLTDYYWVIFPWNVHEDLSRVILEILSDEGEASQSRLRRLIMEKGLNLHSLEAVFPGKFEETLEMMEKRGVLVSREEEGGRTYWKLSEGGK